jgi:peptide/nickel transport system permease protein
MGGKILETSRGAQLLHSAVLRIAIRRLAQSIPVMVGVTFLTFALMNLLPGGAAQALAGSGATRAQIHDLAVKLHLNQPFFERYWHWLAAVATGHLGSSLVNGEPISQMIEARYPVTFELVGISLLVAVLLTIPVAAMASRRPDGVFDRLSTVISFAGLSVPGFVLGIVLILVFAVHLKVLPAIGFTPLSSGLWPNLRSLILPGAALGFPIFCSFVRILRGDMIDQLRDEDHITTARAKGLGPARVLLRHALPNALFGLVTLVGVNLGVLMGSTVLIEEVFGLPGLGQALLTGVQLQDIVVVEGIVVVFALTVITSNFLADLAYALLDPRIRHG